MSDQDHGGFCQEMMESVDYTGTAPFIQIMHDLYVLTVGVVVVQWC